MSSPPDLSGASDQEVVALARQGCEEGYREPVRRYTPSVYNRIHDLVRDHDLAEDLTQDTFVKALAALDRHDPNRRFSAWIARIAFNTAIDHFRCKRLDTLPLSNTPETTPPPGTFRAPAAPARGRTERREAKQKACSRALKRAIRQLPRDQRRCVRLRFFEQRSHDEIAQLLRLPPGTVKTHIHRAMNNLELMLDPHAASWLADSPTDPFYTPA